MRAPELMRLIDNATIEGQARDVARALEAGKPFAQAMQENASISLAEKIGGTMTPLDKVFSSQPGFDLTPAMRASAGF